MSRLRPGRVPAERDRPELERFLLEHRDLIGEQAKVSDLKASRQKPPHSSVVVAKGWKPMFRLKA